MVYLVTWDLNREKPNYSAARDRLIKHLNRYEHIKDAGLDSVWFINTTSSVGQVSDDVRSVMDDNDRLIVVRVERGNHQGWLTKATWDWINARI